METLRSQKFKQLDTERQTSSYPANFSSRERLDIIYKFRGLGKREFSPGHLVSAIIDLKFVIGGDDR